MKSSQIINITESAIKRLQFLVNQNGSNIKEMYIKIGVKRRGCNGLSYTMNYTSEINKLDEIIEKENIKVIIENKAIMYLMGTQMDYLEDDLKSEFIFINPNSKGSCGCGESFNV